MSESTRLADAKGRSSRAQTAPTEGAFSVVETRTTSGGPEAAGAPAVHVPQRYEQAAEAALAREEIPAGYRGAVQRYFDSLDSGQAPPAPTGKPTPAPAPAPAPSPGGGHP